MTTPTQATAPASATQIARLWDDIDSLSTFTVPASRLTDEQLVRAIALCERELRRRKNR